jgi:hypothetical protein
VYIPAITVRLTALVITPDAALGSASLIPSPGLDELVMGGPSAPTTLVITPDPDPTPLTFD